MRAFIILYEYEYLVRLGIVNIHFAWIKSYGRYGSLPNSRDKKYPHAVTVN